MKKITICSFVLIFLIISSCESKYKFWDISKFKIDKNALEDYEEIKLLYSSRGPDDNEYLNYYIHLVVVSQKTGDTVNILTTIQNEITTEDKDKVFNFFNEDNIVTKRFHMDIENHQEFNIEDEDFEKMELKKIDKVARDPKFDYIADNNYPTIIGTIGVFEPNTE
jgi:hypothetical protein